MSTPPHHETELRKKLETLESSDAKLRNDMSELGGVDWKRPHPRRSGPRPLQWKNGMLTEMGYLNILESMGHAIHVFDPLGFLFYWNRAAEKLYGFSRAEALGRNVCDLIVSSPHVPFAEFIIELCCMGQTWTGIFPITHKDGHVFSIYATDTPFYDDDGTIIGAIAIATDSSVFEDVSIFNSDADQSLQTAISSKITNLAKKTSNKVQSKMKMGESNVFRGSENGDYRHFAHGYSYTVLPDCREDGKSNSSFFRFATKNRSSHTQKGSIVKGEDKSGIHKIITSKAETWIGKKTLKWSGRGTDQESSELKSNRFGWPSTQIGNYHRPVENGDSGSSSSSNISSCGSGSGNALRKLDVETDILDYEIMWSDLQVGEQIGQGSCGTVYHGLWYGSDVAIKVFSKQEYSEEVVFSFRQEVSLMKRLRHPNILLFMGAVTSPQRLCIITEFLPRGSLFQLLQKSASKLDWKRRLHMALDIARGMNYLHNCNPPIVHRDLKSSNLLVDKNWSVKVGDFGLSRVKHETYLTTKTGKGTPQWMAPEVLQNERSNEKSDLYSFGVVLWELATQKIPWEHLSPVQVIGAVGFMNQRLDIPEDIDPRWASMIESCWHSEPQSRPTFQELIEKLKEMQKGFMKQFQAARAAAGSTQTEV